MAFVDCEWTFICNLEAPHAHAFGVPVKAYYPDAPTDGSRTKVSNLISHLRMKHNTFRGGGQNLYEDFLRRQADEPAPVRGRVAKTLSKDNQEWADGLRATWAKEATLPHPKRMRHAQTTLDGVVKTKVQMKNEKEVAKMILGAKELAALISIGSSFSAAGNRSFRTFTKAMDSGKDLLLPGRNLIGTTVLDTLHSAVIQWLMTQMANSPGFSVTFDIWTAGAMRYAFVALTFHYILASSFTPQEAVMDLIPINVKHSAFNVAVAVAERIDLHTFPFHVFYGDVTDGAKNVVNAARLLITRFDELVKIATATTEVERNQLVNDYDLQGDDDDDDDVINSGDDEEEETDELDRAFRCVAHSVNLCVGDAINSQPDVKKIVESVSIVVRGIRGSNKRQELLRKVQVEWHHRQLCVIVNIATRWNSTQRMLVRFKNLYDDLVVLFARGAFDDTKAVEYVYLPTRDSLRIIDLLVDTLKPLEEFSVFVQSAKDLTLPHVPLFVHCLYTTLSEQASTLSSSSGTVPQMCVSMAKTLAESVHRRLVVPLLCNPGPALMAALVHPLYGSTILQLIPNHYQSSVPKALKEKLVSWIAHVKGQKKDEESHLSAPQEDDEMKLMGLKPNITISSSSNEEILLSFFFFLKDFRNHHFPSSMREVCTLFRVFTCICCHFLADLHTPFSLTGFSFIT